MIERRKEARIEADLAICVWGIDSKGLPFAQEALARNISYRGALLTGLEQLLRCGDVIGIQYGRKKARFRIIWLRDSESDEKIRAAVQRFEVDACPWEHVLNQSSVAMAAAAT